MGRYLPIMCRLLLVLLLATAICGVLSGCSTVSSELKDISIYEMRVYYAAHGKLEDLHARFRNHTVKLFEKHGIRNIGYWVPVDNIDNKLIFLLGYPSREAREAAWKNFLADPEWKAAQAKSEENGKLVTKAEPTFFQATDYSPPLRTGNISRGGIFNLRTYATPSGSLPKLDARFREHTIKLFSKHGMNNWIYLHKTPDQPGADTTLLYFLTHASPDAAKASFDAFRKDPHWIATKTESEKNGSLTLKDGVGSNLLKPTDYSPTY